VAGSGNAASAHDPNRTEPNKAEPTSLTSIIIGQEIHIYLDTRHCNHREALHCNNILLYLGSSGKFTDNHDWRMSMPRCGSKVPAGIRQGRKNTRWMEWAVPGSEKESVSNALVDSIMH
jgi:hypothetical protein